MRRAAAVCLVVLMGIAPVANAQPSGGDGASDRVSFYGHVFGHGMGGEGNLGPQPANTQFPAGESIYGLGSFHWCTPATTWTTGGAEPGETCRTDEENVLALYSTPGIVNVQTPNEFEQKGAYAQLHNERGQTKDIRLANGSVKATIFLTVDRHGWPVGNAFGTNCLYAHPQNVPCLYPYWGWDVGTQPDFTVEATLYQADLGARDNASAAPPIAEAVEGDAEVVAQTSLTRDLPINGLPGTTKALQYNLDLGAPQVDKIDRSKDFFLTYRFYSESSDEAWGLASWRIWSGEFFPPSFSLPVENPIMVERVLPTFVHDKLAILGVMNTPWGSYDVDADSVELEIEGPDSSAVNPTKLSSPGLSRSLAHGGHYIPVNKTWIWNYRAERGLEPGNYTVTVSASNLQGTSRASCSSWFTLEESASGQLVAGETSQGRCGQQTITEEQAEQLQESANTTSEG